MKRERTIPRLRDAAVDEAGAGGLARHRPRVRGFALRLIGDEALADDLTQETFLRAARTTATLRDEASGCGWLMAIAFNLVRDYFRAARRAPLREPDPAVLERLASSADAERDLLRSEMLACITEYLLRLPAAQRDVLALHEVAGLTHREIGEIRRVSEGHSRVLLHRARAALRVLLEEECTLSFGTDAIPCERRPAEGEGK
jgi:RNA polymerase sigma-70 factor (ECF subfamily)